MQRYESSSSSCRPSTTATRLTTLAPRHGRRYSLPGQAVRQEEGGGLRSVRDEADAQITRRPGHAAAGGRAALSPADVLRELGVSPD